jgi:hypothetical protein
MEVNKLYKVKRTNFQGNTGAQGSLLIHGAGVSIQVLGSKSLPSALADMVDIMNGTLLEGEGAYAFTTFPEYLYFVGTADKIDLIDYDEVDELGELS